ncbi:hypothetical protein NQZ68_039821 [Dissostichus eleginoides]|nr:hypothetical protein NQZ68_039821 [Dissostichus eleginoides]
MKTNNLPEPHRDKRAIEMSLHSEYTLFTEQGKWRGREEKKVLMGKREHDETEPGSIHSLHLSLSGVSLPRSPPPSGIFLFLYPPDSMCTFFLLLLLLFFPSKNR